MTLPSVKLDSSIADEATLIAALATLATSAGWTVVTDGGITWFLSTGAMGDSRIVGGLAATGTRRITAYAASDLDQDGIVSGTVKGYINNDSANTTAAVAKVLYGTDNLKWLSRDNATTIIYAAEASPDSICALVKYASGGLTCEGFIYIGTTEPTAGHELQVQTVARIAAIDASVPATTVVTLDRNINPGLKDSYLGDPYVCAPMFQSVSAPAMLATDFALVQRIPIKAGTLTLSGGATRFSIDATAAGKLTGVPGGVTSRYKAGRGVGDIVRLCAQPTIACAGSSATGAYPQGAGVGNNVSSWDAYGGQGTNIIAQFFNVDINRVTSNKPAAETNKFVSYKIYAVIITNATTMVPQTDNNGKKNVGALKNVIEASFGVGQITDYAIIQVDARKAQRYRILGLFSPNGIKGVDQTGTYKALAIGPGW